jgi:hypothetical protein
LPGAEPALGEVFRRLPLAPPAGFADRVLARAGLALTRAARDPFAAWTARLAIGGALLLAGCASIALPPVAAVLLRLVSPAALVDGAAAALSAGGQALARAFSLVEVFADLGRVAGELAGTPAVAGALAAAALLAMAAFRVLDQLMTSERSSRYARPN